VSNWGIWRFYRKKLTKNPSAPSIIEFFINCLQRSSFFIDDQGFGDMPQQAFSANLYKVAENANYVKNRSHI